MRCLDGEERRGNKEVEEEGKWVSETRVRKKSCRIEKGQRQRELDRETGTVFGEWAKTNQF